MKDPLYLDDIPAIAAGAVLPVNKPKGPTSHDLVLSARRLFAPLSVGHTGTLDPSASGVLVLLLGPATRFSAYFADWDKSYRALVQFGISTDTDDAEGNETERREVALAKEEVAAILPRFTGLIEQVPPAYSAVKQQGKKLYQLARAGEKVTAAPRPVRIHRISIEHYKEGPFPQALLQVDCGEGTYMRALARDMGRDLGVPSHLLELTRTRAGPFTLEQAVPLSEDARPEPLPLRRAFAGWPSLELDDDQVQAIYLGKSLPVEQADADEKRELRVLLWRGLVVGVGKSDRGSLRPARLIPKGIAFRLAGEA